MWGTDREFVSPQLVGQFRGSPGGHYVSYPRMLPVRVYKMIILSLLNE